ncbi:hypothetical protein ACJRO7_004573 [Eucalyptus globulus]|uniref:Uncharacterized protein n=1 Tax=Eucalyptus globulus TaxID=34317 RepID=A0ABD3J328_EUCGL
MLLILSVIVATPFVLMFLKRVNRITRLKAKLGHKKERLQHFKQVESSASPATIQAGRGSVRGDAGGKVHDLHLKGQRDGIFIFLLFIGMIGLTSYSLASGFKYVK